MKKIILSVAVLATGILTQAQLQNPDFEHAENGILSAWKNKPNDLYLWKIDDAVKYSGKNSLQVSNIKDAYTSAQPFSQIVPIPGNGLRKVRLSGYIRSENTTGNIALWAQVKNGEKTTIDFGNSDTQNRKVTPNTDWKEYSLEFIVDDNAKNFLLEAFYPATAKYGLIIFQFLRFPFPKKKLLKRL